MSIKIRAFQLWLISFVIWLNSDLGEKTEWKLAGSATGKNVVDISSLNFLELYVTVHIAKYGIMGKFLIPTIMLNAGEVIMGEGGYIATTAGTINGSYIFRMEISAETSRIKVVNCLQMINANFASATPDSSITTCVYYR